DHGLFRALGIDRFSYNDDLLEDQGDYVLLPNDRCCREDDQVSSGDDCLAHGNNGLRFKPSCFPAVLVHPRFEEYHLDPEVHCVQNRENRLSPGVDGHSHEGSLRPPEKTATLATNTAKNRRACKLLNTFEMGFVRKDRYIDEKDCYVPES